MASGANDGGPSSNQAAVGIPLGFVAPLLVAACFFAGHEAIDHLEPQTSTAGFWYLVTALLAAVVVYSMWPLLAPRVGAFAPWGLFAFFPAAFLAGGYGTSYADWADEIAFVFFVVPVVAAYYLAMLIVLIVQAARGRVGAAMGPILVGGAGLSAGFGIVAVYLLATLQQQAEEARRAHQESPGLEVVVVLAILGATALALRRKRA